MSEEEREEENREEENSGEKEEKSTSKAKKGMGPFQKRILRILLFVLMIFGVSSFLTYSVISKYPETFGLLKGQSIIKREEKALVAEISKSLTLPKDEEPTIATVTDPEKLSEQFFFKNVQKGDKLLIYQNSKKVILYRPSENRVIEVGVVNIKQDDTTKAAQTFKMAILNSTKDTAVVSAMQENVQKIDSTISVTDKVTSVLSYNESFLVDVKGDKKDLAQKLAQGLDVKVGSLSEVEKKPDVDFVLVIGADKTSK